ncbi:MAG: hypothetical protein JO292_07680 [Betaproteobacteria bacterium]|nr:hypothetical protein [Betaproteobacteria bacterium]MBV9361257.1 hypothetical protein [Betaproteobacteria bacterium]
MSFSVYSRALSRAADLVGGRGKLAKVLQVSTTEIDKWIADQAKPPREVFLRIVDLILDETRHAGNDGEAEPPPSRDAAGPSRRYLD